MALIQERVELARRGENPAVMCKLTSGWAVIGDVQFLPGYALLLPDPVVPSLNDLKIDARTAFLADMVMIGDALLEVTGAVRINYEILGNTEPELHAHIFPRYASESENLRTKPVWFYDWKTAPAFSIMEHGDLKQKITEAITSRSKQVLNGPRTKTTQIPAY